MKTRSWIVLAGVVTLAVVASLAGETGDRATPMDGSSVHADGPAVERALLDATRGFVRSDMKQVRSALDRLAAACNRLTGDEKLPAKILEFDRAFHLTLDAAREMATRGNVKQAFRQFYFIQESCHRCHSLAGDRGLENLPAALPEEGGRPQVPQSRG